MSEIIKINAFKFIKSFKITNYILYMLHIKNVSGIKYR